MATLLTCPGGHRWTREGDDAGDEPTCPECGAPAEGWAAETLAASAETIAYPHVGPAAPEVSGPTRPHPADGPRPAASYGFLAPPQGPDEIGRLGPYRILEVLGAGGMGVVFRAEDPQLRRAVAIKTMLPALAADPTHRGRFLREAQAAAAIEHDHIVAIYQVGEDRGVPYLAMPLLQGEPLEARLRREGKLPLAEVLRIGRETAEGLVAAHDRGLIHRDIKPANLWLEGARARVKILDFGLARFAEGGDGPTVTRSGVIVGTPAYMAPEQAGGRPIDRRCDLFSLGCVLYRMATGAPAFHGSDAISTLVAVVNETPIPPAALDPSLSPAFSNLVMHLLAKAPARRPESARAVVDRIAAMEHAPVSAAPPPPTISRHDSPPRPSKRRSGLGGAARFLLGCAVVTLILVAAFGVGIFLLVRQLAPVVVKGIEQVAANERSWEEVARFWRPPPDNAGSSELFPDEVAGRKLVGHDAEADIPDLHIEQTPGHHARYGPGPSPVDVYAFRARPLEKEALFRRAFEAISPPEERKDRPFPDVSGDPGESKPMYHSVTGSAESSRIAYTIGPPNRSGVLWYDKGWLFVVRTPGAPDPGDFLKSYLAALGRPPAPGH